jgi:hypothetical protein
MDFPLIAVLGPVYNGSFGKTYLFFGKAFVGSEGLQDAKEIAKRFIVESR